MFTNFFYLLKAKGLEISTTEWLTFIEALDAGLRCELYTILLSGPHDFG